MCRKRRGEGKENKGKIAGGRKMERLKAPFVATFSRRTIDEKLDKVDGKDSKCRQQLHDRGRTGQMREETIPAVGSSGHMFVDGKQGKHLPEIPDGRVTEGDSTGADWVMETVRCIQGGGYRTVKYTTNRMVGSGSFGVVFKAVCVETGEQVAIKRVLQDRRFKNRELQIMRMIHHPNVVRLLHSFAVVNEARDTYLMLVCEYVPDTVSRICRHYAKSNEQLPMIVVKLYVYQICRSLAYIHRMGICHRDIKPQNLLVDPKTHVLKLCDFGSAKVLMKGEPNIAYICSRYYRAPELIFGATEYSTAIDVWSVGCVMAELLIGSPLFPGESSVDQLVEIIKVLGTPTKEEINIMNPNYTEFNFPHVKPCSMNKLFKRAPPEALDLVSRFLVYNPNLRISAVEALAHPFFDELRNPGTKLPEDQKLPPLFNWLPGELDHAPREVVEKLQGHRYR